MTGWYSSSWKARSLEYGEGGGFPPPFSYATKQSGGDKTHRPPDTAARLEEIAWWNWPEEVLKERWALFQGNAEEFIQRAMAFA